MPDLNYLLEKEIHLIEGNKKQVKERASLFFIWGCFFFALGSFFLIAGVNSTGGRYFSSLASILLGFSFVFFASYRRLMLRTYYFADLIRHLEEHKLMLKLVKEYPSVESVRHFRIYKTEKLFKV